MRAIIASIGLLAAVLFPTSSWEASVTQNLSIQVTPASTQSPTAVSFAPASPVTVSDKATAGTVIAAVQVTTSDGQPFGGTVSIASQSKAGMVSLSSASLPSNVQVASIDSSDDGQQTVVVQATESGVTQSATLTMNVAASGGDPTVGLLPPASDGYSAWSVAGMNAIPFTASLATDGTLTVTASPSSALGPGQVISGVGLPGGITITAMAPTNGLTGAGKTGTYATSCSPSCPSVVSEAMTANGIPNRPTIYRTLSPNGTDDTSQIATALSNCPAGQVVLLTTGVFKISGGGVAIKTNCTLRGSGVGQLLNSGVNKIDGGAAFRACASGSTQVTYGDRFCTDSSATQLVKIDRVTDTSEGIVGAVPTDRGWLTSYNLASDAALGAYTVTLSSTPSPAIQPGDMVWLDEDTTNDPLVVWGPVGYYDPTGFGLRAHRTIAQLAEVSAVNGNTITFDTPINYPYHTSYSAQLTTMQPFLSGAGIENLFLWGGAGNIYISNCTYCWVKNVESTWTNGRNIEFNQTFKNVLRDSYIHETPDPYPGGGGYMLSIEGGSSEDLVENNISWYGNKIDVMRGSGGGNVLGYNYMDDALDDGTGVVSPEAGINAGHFTTPHLELLEGNYSQNFKGDSYWGSSIYITVFRNWFSALRASAGFSSSPITAWSPLYKYTYFDGGHCHYQYGDWNGREAVSVQAHSFYGSYVGNVLGFNGQTLLTNPYDSESCFYGIQRAFMTTVTTTADDNNAGNNNAVVMWYFGTEAVPGGWSFDPTTINTQTITGNWDWVSKAEHCYAYGTVSDQGCSGVTVPNSFYLTSKPAFFGTQPWPWVNPTTGGVTTLPAKYCFEHGMMPTCLQ